MWRKSCMLGDKVDRVIIKGIAEGLCYKEIAPLVQLAPRTVKWRVARWYRKLGLFGPADRLRIQSMAIKGELLDKLLDGQIKKEDIT